MQDYKFLEKLAVFEKQLHFFQVELLKYDQFEQTTAF
jgi:hypothetical protein